MSTTVTLDPSLAFFCRWLALCLVLIAPFPVPVSAAETIATLRTRDATFVLDDVGSLSSIRSEAGDRDYLAPGQPAPLLSLRIDGRLHAPSRAGWDPQTGRLTLEYHAPDERVVVVVAARARENHVVFEVLEVQKPQAGPAPAHLELVLWGPYPTIIGDLIGETVGVVRDQAFAVGLQALNARTLGGYPTQENDIEPDYSADDTGTYPDLPDELRKGQQFRGDTARRTAFGSVLQAYCRNRDRDRTLANWGHEQYVAPAFPDGGVIGSRIALFACLAPRALQTIGAIEVAENLPHPMLDGVWGKTASQANSSYLIVDFGEGTIDRAVEMTKRAGLTCLYHSSPFETWGHFRLKPALFPNGWAGLRACVETARAAGVRVGIHTLSNFITPNDPYVTPRPDPRLARIGVDALSVDLTPEQKEIQVANADLFRKRTALNAVVIGEELVRYGSIPDQPPWLLRECERGAWGTRAVPHARGAAIGRLMDHDYKVFLTDADLSQEVARTIARLGNETGIRQISFDGLEGNWSTGMGQYARTLFTQAWYEALAPELRGQVINDASNPGHFNWHVYTRMNWGEPWYAGFRESQTLYRFKNQLYFERNLMPRMLGWFALRPDTSLEDAEWLLARAAGFRAGFALAASLASTAQLAADQGSDDAARQFGATLAILEAVKQWETARLAGAFPAETRAALRDNTREFHLQATGPGEWSLHDVHAERFAPATEPLPAGDVTHEFTNPHPAQRAQWVLRNAGKPPLTGLTVRINGRQVVALGERPLPAAGALRYSGGADATIHDPAWKELARVPVDAEAANVGPGLQRVVLSHPPQAGASLKLEVRTLGPATPIRTPTGRNGAER